MTRLLRTCIFCCSVVKERKGCERDRSLSLHPRTHPLLPTLLRNTTLTATARANRAVVPYRDLLDTPTSRHLVGPGDRRCMCRQVARARCIPSRQVPWRKRGRGPRPSLPHPFRVIPKLLPGHSLLPRLLPPSLNTNANLRGWIQPHPGINPSNLNNPRPRDFSNLAHPIRSPLHTVDIAFTPTYPLSPISGRGPRTKCPGRTRTPRRPRPSLGISRHYRRVLGRPCSREARPDRRRGAKHRPIVGDHIPTCHLPTTLVLTLEISVCSRIIFPNRTR